MSKNTLVSVERVGGKGAGLIQMTQLGLPVPPGFTITTDVCRYYYQHEQTFPKALTEAVCENLARLEQVFDAKLGDVRKPLLVSVRSGAARSMPGMMDTILNLGLNDETVEGLSQRSNNARFAYDSYRRFIQMFGDVVMGIPARAFEEILSEFKKEEAVLSDGELREERLRELVVAYKTLIQKVKKMPFPQDPREQLWQAICAVFESWMSARAIAYRKINHLDDKAGTAVTIQAMVFGNLGQDCGTGVAFTRHPSTGENQLFGEYLLNAQGEDVVAGIRTPLPIHGNEQSLQKKFPTVYQELLSTAHILEMHNRDMQDIEFTIQNRKLWMLQTRRGKRSAQAAIQIAMDMVAEQKISKQEALMRVEVSHLDQLLHPMIDPQAKKEVIGKGLAASPGAASGRIYFSPDIAEEKAKLGEKVILVRMETSPEDIHGMHVSQGILTACGGQTSHAAVVARGMGKCCVVGCSELHIDYKHETAMIRDHKLKAGEMITLNGSTGEIYLGSVPTVEAKLDDRFEHFMKWIDEVKTMGVRANADTPEDARIARKYGAEGIGLCRTEHMFFDLQRIDAMREMILSDHEKARRHALEKLLPMQRQDFIEIFKAMDGFAVTIRLLDPPLHEFLPHTQKDLVELSKKIDISLTRLKRKARSLDEFNPMLGFRGCRLGIAYPEIYEMQVRAIVEAALRVKREGVQVFPEIMIPIIGDAKELKMLRAQCERVCSQILIEEKETLSYKIGTMIELPRAALTADDIAQEADFFSFGTNDLTQTTLGISRDDANFFLPKYVEAGIYPADPFVTLDKEGVGKLVQTAVRLGRKTKPQLKIGICGEHGGDAASVDFFAQSQLDYVSCSPYRVPLARLAAAQAALRYKA
ncbi:MAG: pyruvate, phosphate dikinase [Deltaproteobacteria bacterium]|nr:pyruvate, phosphate dikinase [Deltaproteobacteria bacterium]